MSLVTTPASKLGTCTTCASTRITEITMTLTDGSVVGVVTSQCRVTQSW
jgi:hypothetical protein